jgi:heme-degrading monooxygenase HmoA
MTSSKTPITLINPFTVPEDKLCDTIAMWEKARDFLKVQPGYISTALHQSLMPDSQYRLINIAKWESSEAFKAATTKMRAEGNLPRIEGVSGAPTLYTVIRN